MKVEYCANNSGGSWCLKDADWLALEKAGWTVEWGGSYFCKSEFSPFKRPEGKPEPCADENKCPGHRRYDSLEELGADRWLDCAAKEAAKDFPSVEAAITEWEEITGQFASDEGCNCCGAPHSFTAEEGYFSGAAVAHKLIGEPETLEEAKRLIKRLTQ